MYYFPTEEDDEDGPTFGEKAMLAFRRGLDIFCVWDCCWPWLKFQEGVSWLVFDPFTELFITLCIVVNTLFMALDHHDMDKDMERALKSGNYVSGLHHSPVLSCRAMRRAVLECRAVLVNRGGWFDIMCGCLYGKLVFLYNVLCVLCVVVSIRSD